MEVGNDFDFIPTHLSLFISKIFHGNIVICKWCAIKILRLQSNKGNQQLHVKRSLYRLDNLESFGGGGESWEV